MSSVVSKLKMRASISAIVLLLSLASATAHQWDSFLNLTGCRPGDKNPVIPDLKKYLLHFGYIAGDPQNPAPFTDTFDAGLASALRTYQRNFNLKPTGALDGRTIHQLMTPRCGVPDFTNGTNSMASSGLRYSFLPGHPVWPPARRTLRWAIAARYPTLNAYILRETFRHALRRWEGVSDFRFFQVSPCEGPDLTIDFVGGPASDGPMGTFARAFAPTDGRLQLDADEDWTDDMQRANSERSFDLESVVVHEVGHILGLGHSPDRNSVMYPALRPMTRRVEISSDEELGIRTLYDEYGYGPLPELHVSA